MNKIITQYNFDVLSPIDLVRKLEKIENFFKNDEISKFFKKIEICKKNNFYLFLERLDSASFCSSK
jgi:hypothetical protein